jgi:uncharacterized protein
VPASNLASCIYVGTIRHQRYFPVPHRFKYAIYMSYLDLDELDDIYRERWFWSTRRRNLVEYRRTDFLGPADVPLKIAVLDRVEAATGTRPDGPVRLLAHLRYFGLSFNPVCFYYCFTADGKTLHSIVAEITNTPWRERFAYVLPIQTAAKHGSAWHWEFAKEFHVSPFLPMGLQYDWRFQAPCDHLRVHMDVYAPTNSIQHAGGRATKAHLGTHQFDTTLVLGRKELSGVNLAAALLRFPFITMGVLLKIYWHALLIRLKKNPFYDHPKLP